MIPDVGFYLKCFTCKGRVLLVAVKSEAYLIKLERFQRLNKCLER